MNKKTNCPLNVADNFSGSNSRAVTSIDWLQIDSRGTLIPSHHFLTFDTEKSTAIFKKLYMIYDEKNYVASIVSEPFMTGGETGLPPNLNLIKLINRELYYEKPVSRIVAISLDHNLQPYRPSRIDVCVDFNNFLQSFKPETLIKGFLYDRFMKKGTRNYIVQGKQDGKNIPHYLKFSKPRSNVDTYLYNKSHEMREVKLKPWIVERWEHGGLDMTEDVWRLEFAIHNPAFNYTNTTTGETKMFNYENLDNPAEVSEIIRVMISKYFDFRRNTGIKEVSDMPKIKLFSGIKDCKIDFTRPTSVESDKADRNFIKRLKELNKDRKSVV